MGWGLTFGRVNFDQELLSLFAVSQPNYVFILIIFTAIPFSEDEDEVDEMQVFFNILLAFL